MAAAKQKATNLIITIQKVLLSRFVILYATATWRVRCLLLQMILRQQEGTLSPSAPIFAERC
jgi:hypothetical protein